MTGREETEEKPHTRTLTSPGTEKPGRMGGSGSRTKGFAITDLLGLESDFRPRQSGPGVEYHDSGDDGHGAGIGGFPFPAGSIPLGLGFLCSLAAQQPAGAPCFLPNHIPLLQARTDRHFSPNRERNEGYSGRSVSFAPSPVCGFHPCVKRAGHN